MSTETFVILFTQLRPLADAERDQLTAQTAPWAGRQQTLGHSLMPHLLAPEREHRGQPLPAQLGDAPPVTALLFLTARDLGEAAEVAGSHPALAYGFHAEVRPWTTPQRKPVGPA